MAYEPLHHKYRPQTFGDLVGQETIALTLSNALEQEKIAPAYLFTGPRGTGKTSSARILAKSLNCLNSDRPTPHPCGKCEVCLAIAKGSALDVMEIDAASNTGVDNIREIIERSRFAPVQCRYKIYAIDECLKGDSLIQTDNELMRIDDPHLKGKKVLSYNESKEVWEYKPVLRWLERGAKKTLTIKTNNHQICCTGNHLIRTETGWIEAKNVKEGMKILSPVDVSEVSTKNLETVESVSHAGHEQVYDLEVEDNHNFIANGLLVHNCHMLSTAAFNALLKTLEEPPPQVVFVLATTDPQRVLSTIISRCQRFDYRRIPLAEMTSHLRYIADAEKIAIADDALTLVAQIANGGLRDAESLLDQLSLLPETITVEKVWDLVGAVPEQDLLKLLQAINCNDSLSVLQQCRNLLDRGREPLVVLQNLAGFYLNLLIAKTAPNHAELTAVTETCWQQLCTEAANWQTTLILRGQQQLQDAETQLKRTTQPRLWLEVTLLGLLPEAQAAVVQRVAMAIPASHPVVTEKINPTPAITIENQLERDHQNNGDNVAKPISPQPDSAPSTHNPIAPALQTAQHSSFDQGTTEESTTLKTTPKVEPPPVAPRNDQDHAANQEIWSKVVSCLQPPTTQALLKQQCHLASFDGMSAIVGVSSANLQKMTQQKIPNIETAFAQVCQRKVVVQLEVASPQGNMVKNSMASMNPPIVGTPTSAPEQPPNPPPPSPLRVASEERAEIKTSSFSPSHQTNQAPLVQSPPARSSNHNLNGSDYAPPSPSNESRLKDRSTVIKPQNSSVLTEPPITTDFSLANNLNKLDNLAAAIVPPPISNETDVAEEYADSELQKAIASLTQSFEGEVVQLNNMESLDGSNSLETIDDLDDLARNDAPFAAEEEQEKKAEILTSLEIPNYSDRPDIEDYNDEW